MCAAWNEAIGFSRRGERLVSFVNSQAMEKFIGRELREKIEKPIIFQPKQSAATNTISERAHGYDATILIDLCQAIIQAKNAGKLKSSRYEKMLQQAEILLSASAKNGIRGFL